MSESEETHKADAGSGAEGSLDWDDLQEEPSFVYPDASLEGFHEYLQEQHPVNHTSPNRRPSSTDDRFLDREGSIASSCSEENLILENLLPKGLLDTVHES